jgi:hypothetical protein
MTINYTWDFVKFNAHSTLNNMDNVVHSIDFILSGSDGLGHASQVFNTVGLSTPADPADFIDFANLTPAQVETWVVEALGDTLNDYKAIIESQIQSQIAPVSLELRPPWQPEGLASPE